MKSMSGKTALLLQLSLIMTQSTSDASAQTKNDLSTVVFFRLSAMRNRVQDTAFDAVSALVGFDLERRDIALPLPRLEDGNGFAIVFGGKIRHAGVEVGYGRSNHTGDWNGQQFTATQSLGTLDVTLYPVRNFPVLPYVLGGLGLYTLTIRDGAVRVVSVKDATYPNLGARFGGGLMIFPVSRFHIQGRITYNLVDYGTVDAGDDKEKFAIAVLGFENIRANVLSVDVGVGLSLCTTRC